MFKLNRVGLGYRPLYITETDNSRFLNKQVDNIHIYDETGVIASVGRGYIEFMYNCDASMIYSDVLRIRAITIKAKASVDYSRGDVFGYLKRDGYSSTGEMKAHLYFPSNVFKMEVGQEEVTQDGRTSTVYQIFRWFTEGDNILITVDDKYVDLFKKQGSKFGLPSIRREVDKPFRKVVDRFKECYPNVDTGSDFWRFLEDFGIELKITKMKEQGKRK